MSPAVVKALTSAHYTPLAPRPEGRVGSSVVGYLLGCGLAWIWSSSRTLDLDGAFFADDDLLLRSFCSFPFVRGHKPITFAALPDRCESGMVRSTLVLRVDGMPVWPDLILGTLPGKTRHREFSDEQVALPVILHERLYVPQ